MFLIIPIIPRYYYQRYNNGSNIITNRSIFLSSLSGSVWFKLNYNYLIVWFKNRNDEIKICTKFYNIFSNYFKMLGSIQNVNSIEFSIPVRLCLIVPKNMPILLLLV